MIYWRGRKATNGQWRERAKATNGQGPGQGQGERHLYINGTPFAFKG